jgi:ABC-2 type transport system ATP-binding protein
MTDVPVLEAHAARIAIDGATVVRELELSTRGSRVLLVGAAEPVMGALGTAVPSGRAFPPGVPQIVGGKLSLLGRDVALGEHRAIRGVAPLDPPLPANWTALEYLRWGARLGGAGAREARALGTGALEVLGLGMLGARRLRTFLAHEARALLVAFATVRRPEVIVLERTLDGLDERAGAWLRDVVGRAVGGRAAVISTSRIVPGTLTADLARTASDVCVLRDGALVVHADPAEAIGGARLYELTVPSGADALRDLLAARGLELRGGPRSWLLRLPSDLGPQDVLALAAEARAAVTVCVPLIG